MIRTSHQERRLHDVIRLKVVDPSVLVSENWVDGNSSDQSIAAIEYAGLVDHAKESERTERERRMRENGERENISVSRKRLVSRGRRENKLQMQKKKTEIEEKKNEREKREKKKNGKKIQDKQRVRKTSTSIP